MQEALTAVTGVDILVFDRTVFTRNANLATAIKNGHESARHLLTLSGADVLVWGTVLNIGGKSIPKLYWTFSREENVAIKAKRYRLTDDIDLPPLFWTDITDVLRLWAISHASDFHKARGQIIGQNIY